MQKALEEASKVADLGYFARIKWNEDGGVFCDSIPATPRVTSLVWDQG